MPETYQFDKQLKMSQGAVQNADVRQVIREILPGVVAVKQASQRDDRNGTDWWAEYSGGHRASIDAKVRKEDWAAKPKPQDDLALELFSVKGEKRRDGSRTNRRVIGWTLNEKKRTDYVLWLWKDTRRFCLVPFRMLCKVFQEHRDEWRQQYRCCEQFTEPKHGEAMGWWSECVFVPRRVVWAAIYKRFSPNPP